MSDTNFWKNPRIAQQYIKLTKEDFIKEKLAISWLKQEIEKLNLENKKIVDLGCGNGYFTNKLFSPLQNKAEIIGIDFSEHLLEYAQNNYPYLKFILHDLRKPFPKNYKNYFDLAISISVLMDIDDLDTTIKNISEILKENAIFYIIVTHPLYNLLFNFQNFENDGCENIITEFLKKYPKEEPITVRFEKLITKNLIAYRRPESSYINTLAKYNFKTQQITYLTLTKELAENYKILKNKVGIPVFYCLKVIKL